MRSAADLRETPGRDTSRGPSKRAASPPAAALFPGRARRLPPASLRSTSTSGAGGRRSRSGAGASRRSGGDGAGRGGAARAGLAAGQRRGGRGGQEAARGGPQEGGSRPGAGPRRAWAGQRCNLGNADACGASRPSPSSSKPRRCRPRRGVPAAERACGGGAAGRRSRSCPASTGTWLCTTPGTSGGRRGSLRGRQRPRAAQPRRAARPGRAGTPTATRRSPGHSRTQATSATMISQGKEAPRRSQGPGVGYSALHDHLPVVLLVRFSRRHYCGTRRVFLNVPLYLCVLSVFFIERLRSTNSGSVFSGGLNYPNYIIILRC